jgi:hypothetical protein
MGRCRTKVESRELTVAYGCGVTNRQTPPFRSYYRSHRNVGGWGNYLVILFVGKKIIINKVGRKGLPWRGTTAGLGQQ